MTFQTIPAAPSRAGTRARFRPDRLVKETGGVRTFFGTDLETGRPVVIKSTSAAALSSDAKPRLAHEATVLARLDSRWVAPLLAWTQEDDGLSLVTAYIPGVTVEERLRGGPLSLADTLTLGRCLFQALGDIHRHGVLHRDLKPANLIVNADGPVAQATIIDFGLARSHGLGPAIRDLPVGTVRYIAPEQAGLMKVEPGPWSDLYSAGILLFECLAGRPPFQAEWPSDLLRQHLTEPVPRLRTLGLPVPRALDEILQRLLRKEPLARYQSADGALGDWADLADAVGGGETDPPIAIGSWDRRRTVTEPAFVGRREELAVLEARWQEARRGAGGLVLVEAEAGLGKTRLLQELAHRCESGGGWVLRGQGRERTAQRPFQMLEGVVDALVVRLRSDTAWAAALRQRLGAQAEAVAVALPAVAAPLGLAASPNLGPEEFGERRSLTALAALLDALGDADGPVLLLLDDCQWADDLSLKLLPRWHAERVSGARAGRPILLVAALRSEEASADHPLRRLAGCAPLRLLPFGAPEVRCLMRSMAGPLPEEAIEAVTRLSSGNPFMAAALLQGMVEAGALIAEEAGWRVEPTALAQVRSSDRAAVFLARRLERLPADVLRLLCVAAVMGKEFDPQVAAALAGLTPDRVARGIEEAGCRHLVWMDRGTGCCRFVHDKIRDACLLRLSEAERRALHRRTARLLEARGTNRVFDLAYHFDAAGDSEQALPYALRAADEARRRFALEIAERQYRIAERGAADADRATRYRIAEGLGDVLMLRGRYDEAREQFERARSLADRTFAQAQIEGKLGELAFKRGDVKTAGEAIEGALRRLGQRVPHGRLGYLGWLLWEVLVQTLHTWLPSLFLARRSLDQAGPERLAIRLYSRLTYVYWFSRGTLPSLWTHLREMNLAERYPPTPELAQAYSEHAPVMSLLSRFDRGLAYAARSLSIRQELDDPWGQGQSLHFRGIVLYAAARFQECLDACQQALRLFERTGDQWEVMVAQYHIGFCRYRLGDLDVAVQIARHLYELGSQLGDHALGFSLELWAKAAEGQVPAHAIHAQMERTTGDVERACVVLQAEGVRLLAAGRPAEAAAVLEQAGRIVKRAGLMNAYVAPAFSWALTAGRMAVEEASPWALAGRKRPLRHAEQLARFALHAARRFQAEMPRTLREAGLLAAMRGRRRRARTFLQHSLAVADRQGARYEYAQSLLARGRVGLAHSWPGAAEDIAEAERLLADMRAGIEGETSAPPPAGDLSLADRYTALQDVGRTIAAALSPDAVFAAVREGALRLLRGDRCLVLTVEPDTGRDAVPRLQPDHRAVAYSRTLVRQALVLRRPVLATEGLPPEADASLVFAGVRSALSVPILVRDAPAACLYVAHGQIGGLFGEEERRLAEYLATLAGVALENAAGAAVVQALSDHLRRHTEALEANRTALRQAYDEMERRIMERTATLAEANARLRREIAERQRAEAALRESETRYRMVAETAADAIITIDEDGLVVFANRAAERIFGYTPEELRGRPLTVLMPEPLRTRHRQAFDRYLATGTRHMAWQQLRLTGRHRSGRAIPLELAFWEYTQQGRRYFGGLIRDISDQLQIAELRARFLEHVMSAQEEERRRLARELHDDTGQALMSLLVGLHTIEAATTLHAAKVRARRFRQVAARTLDEIRGLAMGLRPRVLDDLGLVAAIERHVAEYEKAHGISVDLHVAGLEGTRLSPTVETALYRVIQEALTNVAKHARATIVSLLLERRAGLVRAIVEDNGRGFDVESTSRQPDSIPRLGLQSMRERVALASGTVEIESTPGRGTTLYVSIPDHSGPDSSP